MSRRALTTERRTWAALALVVAMLATLAPVASADAAHRLDDGPVELIVRAEHGMLDQVRRHVASIGGTITLDLPIVDGFAASVPAAVAGVVSELAGVASVTPDGSVSLHGHRDHDDDDDHRLDVPPIAELTTQVLDLDRLWRRGITGEGVGVALIDSGVTPVGGLDADGKVFNGPDLSFDGPFESVRHLDVFGHGTHLAGIIAGRDPDLPDRPRERDAERHFAGVAPDAHVISVKVADGMGTADVSQVIAGIQWVIEHKDDPEVNIRVLTLAFGTDSVQDYQLDPLAYAVEQAWHAGLVVVVAAGNDGNAEALRNPASDPYVVSVGATDPHGTSRAQDDRVLDFSNCGVGDRRVDVVAPGRSISSLRVDGSYIDSQYPEAADGERFFRGTGTSQAAAVTAGVVALMLERRPDLTPDQVKTLLTDTSDRVRSQSSCRGARTIDPDQAVFRPVPKGAEQDWPRSDGSGSLEAARGSYHVYRDGEPLVGEIDVTGGTWSGGTWSGGTWSGGTWSGGTWSGGTWSGGTWSGGTWSGGTWSGGTWSGGTWSGGTWSGGTWSGGTWSGGTWSGGTWSTASWG